MLRCLNHSATRLKENQVNMSPHRHSESLEQSYLKHETPKQFFLSCRDSSADVCDHQPKNPNLVRAVRQTWHLSY